MKKFISLWTATILSLPLLTAKEISIEYFEEIQLVSVYDGDTFMVNLYGLPEVFGNRIPVRVRGIDTPEIRGSQCEQERRNAREAKRFVEGYLSKAQRINLINVERGKYFRLIADVEVDGQNLAQLLLDAGLAQRYLGVGLKPDWCNG